MWRSMHYAILLCGLACPLPLAANEPPVSTDLPKGKQPTLSDLGKIYRDLELPLPPKNAGFACVSPPLYRWQVNREKINYELRFVVDAEQSRTTQRIWSEFAESDYGKIEQTYPKAPSPDIVLQFMKLNRMGMESSHFEVDRNRPELILAIQCYLLGHDELAGFFYWRCATAHSPEHPLRLSLDRILVIAAWNYWATELTNPVQDRAKIAKVLKMMNKKYNVINTISYYYEGGNGSHKISEYHNLLLTRLDLTLDAAPAKPGTIEWMVGKLAEVTEETDDEPQWKVEEMWNRKSQIQRRKAESKGKESEMERKLRDLGFEAIPVLIEHVDDKRLTRIRVSMNNGLGGSPWRTVNLSGFTTVDQLVRKILATFFDLNMDRSGEEWKTKKSDYLNAWEKIKLKTEDQFVLEKLENPKEIEHALFKFFMARFPRKTIEFYKEVLSKNIEFPYFYSLVNFILDSDLPRTTKIELLTQGVHHTRLDFQSDALAGLRELDNPLFTKLCLESLAKPPKELKENGHVRHHLRLLQLALSVQDRTTQQFVADSVKSLAPHLKAAMLENTNYIWWPSKKDALLFYASFLQDSDIYSKSEKNEETYPGGFPTFDEIEVRNFAAYQILKLLEIDCPLNESTPGKTWTAVRAFVKNEIDRRTAGDGRK